jgi:hypothetical protein
VIFDCFMLRDELDMLQMRLEELADLDVTHLLVEATQDHQGHPKPLHFAENQERFARWADRIRHVVVTDLPDHPNPWVREHAQRDAALTALAAAHWDDLVLIADIDEIPDPGIFTRHPGSSLALTLMQKVYAFCVDWMWQADPTSVLTTAGHARGVGSLAKIRDGRALYPQVWAAGWHFSWIGGAQACREKLDAFCHLEAREIVRQGIDSGDFIERGLWNVARLTPVDVDETWPAMIRERRCPPEWFRPRQTHHN